ncbi:MAG: glycosyltransferase family 1 protein [Patescibacteria group bacterium]|jgi:glycosyltransferase involved in cell wall biosynthesis
MKTYGIDANVLTRAKKTGTERYTRELLREMMTFPLQDDERVILYSSALIPDFVNLPKGWELKILDWKLKKGWTHMRLSWELLVRTPNLFFSPAHEIPLFHGRTKIVSTVHDVAFRLVPEVYTEANRKRQEWAVGRAVKQAKRIITVSETTKNDLMRFFGVAKEKIVPIHLAVKPEQFMVSNEKQQEILNKYHLNPGLYFVSVGRIEKKKNIPFLLDAFDAFKKDRGIGDPYCLVLIGSMGEERAEIEAQLNQLACKDSIHGLGYLPDEEIRAILSGAIGYVFPSNYEGFGIPSLEAMASRIPLIASDIPALREVAGEAAIFCGPKDVGAWKNAMKIIADDQAMRADLVLKGSERLQDFSWKKTAEKTWEVLRGV